MEAKLEDTEKTREKLAAQLRPVLLQGSCEQKAKAATELQVHKVWINIHVSAIKGKLELCKVLILD